MSDQQPPAPDEPTSEQPAAPAAAEAPQYAQPPAAAPQYAPPADATQQPAPPAFPAGAGAAPQYAQPPTGAAGLILPPGVTLAPAGRRVGAYFLSLLLMIVTLWIGWFIWGLIVWSKGTSPALQVLGMRAWKPLEQKPASWGTMALRNIIGGICQNIVGLITEIISFVMFLSDDLHRSIPDRVGGTVIVYDPNKVLG